MHQEDNIDTDKNEDNYSSKEVENDNRFAFVRSVPEDAPETNQGL